MPTTPGNAEVGFNGHALDGDIHPPIGGIARCELGVLECDLVDTVGHLEAILTHSLAILVVERIMVATAFVLDFAEPAVYPQGPVAP